jgi:hypothetical protein
MSLILMFVMILTGSACSINDPLFYPNYNTVMELRGIKEVLQDINKKQCKK